MKDKLLNLRSRVGFVSLFKTVFHLSGEKIIKVIVGLFVQVWLARFLGPEKIGKINYIIEFSFLFTIIVGLGLDDYLLNVFNKDKTHLEENVNKFFSTRLVVAFVVYLATVVTAFIVKGEDPLTFFMICFFSLVIFTKPFETMDSLYHAQLNVQPLVRSRQTGYFLAVLCKVSFILLGLVWPFFVIANFLEYLFSRILNIINFRKDYFKICFTFSPDSIFKTVKFGLPYLLISLIFFLEFKMGIFLVSRYLGPFKVGVLAVTLNLLATAEFFFQILFTSTLPAIINSKNTSEKLYKKRFQLLLIIITFTYMFLLICAVFFGNYFVTLLFGPEYLLVAELLPIGIIFLMVNTFNLLRLRWFMLDDSVMKWLLLHAVAFFISLSLQCLYLEEFGVKLVFLSVVISHIIVSLLMTLDNKHKEALLFFLKK